MCIETKPISLSPLASTSLNTNNEATGSDVLKIQSTVSASTSSRSKRHLSEGSISSQGQSSSIKRSKIKYCTCTTQCDGTCLSPDEYCAMSQLHYRGIRKVRFGGHQTFVSATHSFSECDAKKLWYGLDECADMNEASKATVRDFREQPQHKDIYRHVLSVASQCSYSPPPLAYLEAVRLTLPEEARGLELGLLPIRTRQRRQEHVRKVVQIQNQIEAGKAPFKNCQQIKTKVLAIQAMQSSQASRLFAQLLARNVNRDGQQGGQK
jgi:hypothetical protein